jgi:hypothetical protein
MWRRKQHAKVFSWVHRWISKAFQPNSQQWSQGGLQRDVAYLGWPIELLYMNPNAGGGGSCLVTANECSCIHRSPITRDLTPYFNLWMEFSMEPHRRTFSFSTENFVPLAGFPVESSLQSCVAIWGLLNGDTPKNSYSESPSLSWGEFNHKNTFPWNI